QREGERDDGAGTHGADLDAGVRDWQDAAVPGAVAGDRHRGDPGVDGVVRPADARHLAEPVGCSRAVPGWRAWHRSAHLDLGGHTAGRLSVRDARGVPAVVHLVGFHISDCEHADRPAIRDGDRAGAIFPYCAPRRGVEGSDTWTGPGPARGPRDLRVPDA